jgi:hypothetical protein
VDLVCLYKYIKEKGGEKKPLDGDDGATAQREVWWMGQEAPPKDSLSIAG